MKKTEDVIIYLTYPNFNIWLNNFLYIFKEDYLKIENIFLVKKPEYLLKIKYIINPCSYNKTNAIIDTLTKVNIDKHNTGIDEIGFKDNYFYIKSEKNILFKIKKELQVI